MRPPCSETAYSPALLNTAGFGTWDPKCTMMCCSLCTQLGVLLEKLYAVSEVWVLVLFLLSICCQIDLGWPDVMFCLISSFPLHGIQILFPCFLHACFYPVNYCIPWANVQCSPIARVHVLTAFQKAASQCILPPLPTWTLTWERSWVLLCHVSCRSVDLQEGCISWVFLPAIEGAIEGAPCNRGCCSVLSLAIFSGLLWAECCHSVHYVVIVCISSIDG